jgi:hypothetical protein
VDHQLGAVVAQDRHDLEQIGACLMACSMSSSAMPCFRADGWISTTEL